jgi:hypothetical protein
VNAKNMCIIVNSKPYCCLLKYIVLPDLVVILDKNSRAYTKRNELFVSLDMDKLTYLEQMHQQPTRNQPNAT